jgi:sigma-B regulation protein RsbU (phosphoserine phosphatase)
MPVNADSELVAKLTALNRIGETLNRAADVRGVLDQALAALVELMGLETGWIALKENPGDGAPGDGHYALVSHCNLPPALADSDAEIWAGRCTCQEMCDAGRLTEAYNEVQCSRLARATGDRRGLAVHASAPLRSGERTLGILNVAGPDWSSFNPEALALLTAVGGQIGVALERAQLYDMLRERRIREQATLLDLSNKLLNRLTPDELADDLLSHVHTVLGNDAGALLLPNGDNLSLRFVAARGWHTDPAAAGHTVPLPGASGPSQVMRSRSPLQVEDLADSNPTGWTPAWLVAEGFRGHSIVPLLVDDHAVGVLVVNQRRPRLLAADDLRLLQLMANQAAIAIEKARLYEKEFEMQALEKELALGREIQLSLLPEAPPNLPGWEFAAHYQAAREVGGDFYDFLPLPAGAGHVGLVIADVSGKGVPAALVMARTCAMIHTAAQQGHSPSAALAQANALLVNYTRSHILLTALCAFLDTGTGRLAYANGGHNRPLWFHAHTGTVEELATPGIILGAFETLDLEESAVDLAPGDLLVLYTDGVTEAMDGQRVPFGEARLQEIVRSVASEGGGAEQVVAAIVGAVEDHVGTDDQSDDLTLVVVRRSTRP